MPEPKQLPMHLDPRLLTVAAAARYSSFSRSGIYLLAKEGKLEMLKNKSRTYITKASLDRLIDGLSIVQFPI
jgi:hypothetical protein